MAPAGAVLLASSAVPMRSTPPRSKAPAVQRPERARLIVVDLVDDDAGKRHLRRACLRTPIAALLMTSVNV